MSSTTSQESLSLDLSEAHEGIQVSRVTVERMHLFCTALTCFFALAAALARRGEIGIALAASLAVLCLVALIVSHSIRVLLGDFYRQFRYKEKFLLFLAHCVALVLPSLALGVRGWEMALAALLLFLCVQGIDRVFFGRIYAVTLALTVFLGIARDPALPMWIVMGWYASLLLAIRFGHVRFRLDAYGEGDGLDLGDTLRRTMIPVLVPCAVGGVAWLAARMWLSPRALVIPGFQFQDPGFHQASSTAKLLWDAFFIVMAIIAVIVILGLIDKKLRRRKRSAAPDEEAATGALSLFRVPAKETAGLRVDPGSGPRERILATFAQFSHRLEPLGHSRREDETADDWIERLVQHYSAIRPMSDRLRRTFNAACYHTPEPTDADANGFAQQVDTGIGIVRAELEHRQRESAATRRPPR